ncbi:MAG: Do family serine endopeptidase [Bacteroidales bacterium]
MKVKNALFILMIATLGGIIALAGNKLISGKEEINLNVPHDETIGRLTSQTLSGTNADFTYAAEKTVHGVVHIKTISAANEGYSFYDFFFRNQPSQPNIGIGSGVIVSTDGYIVTNNHVVDMSNEIEVVLNDKRSFKAKVIGKDPSTDLALIKIDATDLPVIPIGNSDDVKVGQWVLAVGNPFNLTSTVTAGIVSAKGRNINIMQGQYSIESFIQTDAAVNPGNSGGALVNIEGELIGINSAIATQTGSYTGYSFAIPSSIVTKVIADMKEYGVVQRAVLGVVILDMTDELSKSLSLDKIQGVYIEDVLNDGSAAKAGLMKNDVIIKIGEREVNTVAELQEQVSTYKPGDKITVTYIRDKKIKVVSVTLQNKTGGTEVVNSDNISALGATFAAITKKEKESLGITNGVKVSELYPGKLLKAGVRKGYIITHVNKIPVNSAEDIAKVLKDASGGVYLRGIYSNGLVEYYAFGME